MEEVAVLAVLSALAAGMASLTAVVVQWTAFTTTPYRASVVQFVLLMMAGMFTGVLVYFGIGGIPGVVAGFWVAGVWMSASVLLVFLAFAREHLPGHKEPAGPPALAHRTGFAASVVGLVLVNEVLMGWSFSLLSHGLPVGLGPGGDRLGLVLAGAVVSPWFVFPMALEMALTLRWLLHVAPAPMRRYLLIQPAAMVCSPPTLAGLPWAVTTAAGASVVMALAVGFLLLSLFRGEDLPARVLAFAECLLAIFGVMAVGLYLWAVFGNTELFAVSLLLQMILFLHASTDPFFYSERSGVPIDSPASGERSGNPFDSEGRATVASGGDQNPRNL